MNQEDKGIYSASIASTQRQCKSSKTERLIASHYDQFFRGTVVKTHVKTNCFLLTVYCLDCLVPKFMQS